jgi:hypothetical protein
MGCHAGRKRKGMCKGKVVGKNIILNADILIEISCLRFSGNHCPENRILLLPSTL